MTTKSACLRHLLENCVPRRWHLQLDACDADANRFGNNVASRLPEWPWENWNIESLHGADLHCLAVAGASILAKVTRDKMIEEDFKGFGNGCGFRLSFRSKDHRGCRNLGSKRTTTRLSSLGMGDGQERMGIRTQCPIAPATGRPRCAAQRPKNAILNPASSITTYGRFRPMGELEPEVAALLRKYALQNALEYDGQGQVGSVMGRVMGENADLRSRAKELTGFIASASQ